MHRATDTVVRMLAGVTLCLLLASICYAAKPDKDGNSSATSGTSAEIYWIELDYPGRTLTIYGVHLITGDAGSPTMPGVWIAGRQVAIDETPSVASTDFSTGEGSLVISFDELTSGLSELLESTPQGNAIRGRTNLAVKATSSGDTVISAVYLSLDVIETASPPPTTGTCPCTTYYDSYYDELYALIWPTCTAPASSNPPLTGTVAVVQYIDAQFLHELEFQTISIGSDSSSSSRSSLAGTCHVRTGDYWPMSEANGVFAESPMPVSDEDHMACVAEIIAREAICRGGNWMDP